MEKKEQIVMKREHNRWAVIEDTHGVLSLIVLKDDKPLFLHTGYEKEGKMLLCDMNELSRENGYPVSTWCGNELSHKQIPSGVVVCDHIDFYPKSLGRNGRKVFGC